MTTKSPSGAIESDSDWSRVRWPLRDTEGDAVRDEDTAPPSGKKGSGVLRSTGATTLSQQIEDEDGEE